LKRLYWIAIDTAEKKTHTAEAATGLDQFGTVRPLDPPQHPAELRDARDGLPGGAAARGKAPPPVDWRCCSSYRSRRDFLLLLNLPQPIQIAIATLAAISASAGVLTERWLFFAEAEHVVMLYYRGGTA